MTFVFSTPPPPTSPRLMFQTQGCRSERIRASHSPQEDTRTLIDGICKYNQRQPPHNVLSPSLHMTEALVGIQRGADCETARLNEQHSECKVPSTTHRSPGRASCVRARVCVCVKIHWCYCIRIRRVSHQAPLFNSPPPRCLMK